MNICLYVYDDHHGRAPANAATERRAAAGTPAVAPYSVYLVLVLVCALVIYIIISINNMNT